jgi:hypothetical protein
MDESGMTEPALLAAIAALERHRAERDLEPEEVADLEDLYAALDRVRGQRQED